MQLLTSPTRAVKENARGRPTMQWIYPLGRIFLVCATIGSVIVLFSNMSLNQPSSDMHGSSLVDSMSLPTAPGPGAGPGTAATATATATATTDAKSNAASVNTLGKEKTKQEKYYDEAYFSKQQAAGILSGKEKQWTLENYVGPDTTLLDFGSGGCHLLHYSKAGKKIGVELNGIARAYCTKERPEVETHASLQEIPDKSIDVITSMSVIEHVESPVLTMRELLTKLRPGGYFITHVKNEGVKEAGVPYSSDNWDQHLYTWTAQTWGNLLVASGFELIKIDTFRTEWPPNWRDGLFDRVGMDKFRQLSMNAGKTTQTWSIFGWARRPLD
jgi:SAM-dependent methyltransferase